MTVLVFAVLGLGLAAESWAGPLPLASVGCVANRSPVYSSITRINADCGQGAVIELPMYVAPAPEYPETKRMMASTSSWWGLVNGYSGFTPQRQITLGKRLEQFPSPAATTAIHELGHSGVRYLVVHSNEAPFDLVRWQTSGQLEIERQTSYFPLGQFGSDYLYLINPYGDQLVTRSDQVADPFWATHCPQPVAASFLPEDTNNPIELLAALILRDSVNQGKARLTLYWRTTGQQKTSFTVFTHSLDASGSLLDQSDKMPVNGRWPITEWSPGEIVQDNHVLAAGDHYLVGLYDLDTGQRVPAFGPRGGHRPDDSIQILAENHLGECTTPNSP